MEVRRSKAIGILAQPAQAVQLLCEHQGDEWDGAAEPVDVAEGAAEAEKDAEPVVAAGHQSLRLAPPPFDPDRARPRAVVYVHLSSEALSASSGVARVEEVGPVLLGRLRSVLGDRCMINLKPVIDLRAGHTPVDSMRSQLGFGSTCSSGTRLTCSPTPQQSPGGSMLITLFVI